MDPPGSGSPQGGGLFAQRHPTRTRSRDESIGMDRDGGKQRQVNRDTHPFAYHSPRVGPTGRTRGLGVPGVATEWYEDRWSVFHEVVEQVSSVHLLLGVDPVRVPLLRGVLSPPRLRERIPLSGTPLSSPAGTRGLEGDGRLTGSSTSRTPLTVIDTLKPLSDQRSFCPFKSK